MHATNQHPSPRVSPVDTRISFYRRRERKKGMCASHGVSARFPEGGMVSCGMHVGMSETRVRRFSFRCIHLHLRILQRRKNRTRALSRLGDLPSLRVGKPFNPFILEDMRTASERRDATSVIAASETKWQARRRSDGAFSSIIRVFHPPTTATLYMRFISDKVYGKSIREDQPSLSIFEREFSD